MKLELDFDTKIIVLTDTVKLNDLIETIKSLNLNPEDWTINQNISIGYAPYYTPYPIIPCTHVVNPLDNFKFVTC